MGWGGGGGGGGRASDPYVNVRVQFMSIFPIARPLPLSVGPFIPFAGSRLGLVLFESRCGKWMENRRSRGEPELVGVGALLETLLLENVSLTWVGPRRAGRARRFNHSIIRSCERVSMLPCKQCSPLQQTG